MSPSLGHFNFDYRCESKEDEEHQANDLFQENDSKSVLQENDSKSVLSGRGGENIYLNDSWRQQSSEGRSLPESFPITDFSVQSELSRQNSTKKIQDLNKNSDGSLFAQMNQMSDKKDSEDSPIDVKSDANEFEKKQNDEVKI